MSIDTLLAQGAAGIVAIVRGVAPEQALEVGTALVQAGIRIIEVPLNSPRPLESITRLENALGREALIGAGTVLSTKDVDAVATAGGRLIVTPNTNPAVISRALERGLHPMPGFLSPSEAFAAIAAGARDLKLFPARTSGAGHLAAVREVLPSQVRVWAVGGIDATNLGGWLASGAVGVGVGGSLYRPGATPETVAAHARELVAAWHAARQHQ